MPHFSVKPIFPEVIAVGQLPDYQKYRDAFEKCVEHDSKIEGAMNSNSLDPNNLKHSSCPNEKDEHGLNGSEGIRLYLRPLVDARIDTRPTFSFEPTIANEITFQSVTPEMKNDTYLIFPSYLNHEVPPNGDIEGTRRTLAMNFIPDRIDMDSYFIEIKK